jgi:hypothetical protein
MNSINENETEDRLFYKFNIYDDQFIFIWEKLYNNISPYKMPVHVSYINNLVPVLIDLFNYIIDTIEEAHNLPKSNSKENIGKRNLDIIKDFLRFLILTYENENIEENKPFKESFPNNYFSKLISEYEPNRSFFYICRFKLDQNLIPDELKDKKYISMVLPIIEVDKKDMFKIFQKGIFEMKFCLIALEFITKDLNDYIDNIHHLNYFS